MDLYACIHDCIKQLSQNRALSRQNIVIENEKVRQHLEFLEQGARSDTASSKTISPDIENNRLFRPPGLNGGIYEFNLPVTSTENSDSFVRPHSEEIDVALQQRPRINTSQSASDQASLNSSDVSEKEVQAFERAAGVRSGRVCKRKIVKIPQIRNKIMRNGRRSQGKKRHPVLSPFEMNMRAKTPKTHGPDLSFLSNWKLIPRELVQNASQQIVSQFSTCDEKTLSLLARMFFGIASPEACALFQTACKVVHERRDVSWPVNLASVGVSVRALGTLGNYNNVGSILERYHMLRIVGYFDERQQYHRDQMAKGRTRELLFGYTKQRAVKENEGSKRAVSLALDDLLLEVCPDLSGVPPRRLRRAPQRTALLHQCNASANWLLMEKMFTFGSLALVPTGGTFTICNREYVHVFLSSQPADAR